MRLEGDDGAVAVAYGRDVCADLVAASGHEWLVTNGIGGYASGTIDGSLTRRYHGLLIAALAPPGDRTLLAVKFDERVEYRGAFWDLGNNRWTGGTVEPKGFLNLERFFLDGTMPVWHYAFSDALLERRVALLPGCNASAVRYRLLRGSEAVRIVAKAVIDYRDFHSLTRSPFNLRLEAQPSGVRASLPFAGATPVVLDCDRGTCRIAGVWFRDFDLPAERERGLDDREDHLHAATFEAEVALGEMLTLRAAAGDPPADAAVATFERVAAREVELLDAWRAAQGAAAAHAPPAVRQLVLAADQFIVAHPLPGFAQGRSIVAGYHWFNDWGRDAMISLPGLTLTTGRSEIAGAILRTFDRFVDRGMLPNDFPERGGAPEFNSADASLWYVEAVRAYAAATGDDLSVAEWWPTLESIVAHYDGGTRYGIGVDPADGLLRAGVPGVQVTWMDARVGDRVVTARIGKPVELNALWYNALRSMSALAARLGRDAARFEKMAERVRASFDRFRDDATGGLRDVVDGPNGDDRSIRPNQLFAVALHASPLEPDVQRGVVGVCARELLTSYGLRSLSPSDSAYVGRYEGGVAERDGAYHQGTVWTWLIGPFALAHARAFGDRATALGFLEPLLDRVVAGGVGTLGEIADGDPPFTPRGCIAQAWSVAEVLRAWHALRRDEAD